MTGTGICDPEVPEQTDPGVAGTSPVREWDVGVSAARLLPVGDTDESLGTGTHVVFLAGNGQLPGTDRDALWI